MPTLLTTSWLAAATTTAMTTDIRACIAAFTKKTQRTDQIDATFATFGIPKDLVDIVYSYVPRAVSPNDIASMFKRGTATKLCVVGTITIDALTRSYGMSLPPMSAAQKAAANTIVQRGKTVHIFAELEVPCDYGIHGVPYIAYSCVELSDCLSVEYTVGFTHNGTLDYITVELLDPHSTGTRTRLRNTWFFYRFGAPPTLRVFAVDERA